MPSERIQRQIDALLDEADEAVRAGDWSTVRARAEAALAFDPDSEDARGYLQAAERGLAAGRAAPEAEAGTPTPSVPSAEPDSFAGGRYVVQRFLGEGGKKRVYLAHDELLDRDVAFALIKTDGLDEVGRERVVREAQAMGRMGVHPHIVSILDFGEAESAPYVVTELMGGGDVEGLLEDADGALPLAQALEIAKATARGLVFAHEQGVVHRDLKPGNVWLTADGVAKIGDFGLAVAEGRSRLTQHGMMVGTFGYMPPEQALGQEVTPQADLYSLGAMLYELVTGNPPFAGDDATAVISQHINTAPVRPSLRSEHCPPDLEALVLRLLAKAPDDRPASATEVLEILEAVDPEARSASDSQLNPLDRLARGVFVGREAELERLRNAFDEALSGRGSVVMLVGEPGIGKSRTAQELETYARMRGAQVLWGRAHEASGAPAYWPWVQVGRSWGRANDVAALAEVLGGAGSELVRLFPELPGLLGQQPQDLPAVADESAQFRLFDAYTSFLRAASEGGPLVLVLDDLHWADKPTLLLLQHLARELANMRLLVVGTYRDTELARTHPLSETLAELNREGGFERVVLRGLDEPEVRAYLAATTGREPARELVTRVYEETEGNPFFLSEVVNLMTEEGSLDAGSVSDIALPDGVREALGRRLDRLSEEANELLTMASVVGREFEYETLKLLTEHDDDALLALLEEGLAARAIEELDRPGRYRFSHALMQETLLAELSTTRRVRLHGEVAEALERQYGDRAEDFAARLAAHYGDSATLNASHAQKAYDYALQAAEQSERSAGWPEAARLYELCLALAEEGSAAVSDAGSLLVAAGRCNRRDGNYRSAWRQLQRAIDVYREHGRWEQFAEAVWNASQVPAPRAQRLARLNECLVDPRVHAPPWEARLLLSRILLHVFQVGEDVGEGADPITDLRRAEALIQEHVLNELQPALLAARAYLLPVGSTERIEGFEAALRAFDAAQDREGAANASLARFLTTWNAGALDEAVRLGEEHLQRLRSGPFDWERLNGHWGRGQIALTRADYEATRRFAALMPEHNFVRHQLLVGIAERTGELLVDSELLPSVEAAGRVPAFELFTHAIRARAFLATGRNDEAAAEIERFEEVLAGFPHETPLSPFPTNVTTLGDRFLHLIGDESAQHIQDLLRPLHETRAGPCGSVDGFRGWLALRLDLINDAERHFRTGFEWCERERCPVEAGRCLEGLAEIAEQRGEREQAMEYLDRAGELFSRHGAKLYLDQVLAKKEILKA